MEFIKKHFTLVELKSVVQTFIASRMVDGGAAVAFNTVLGGDWSTAALVALSTCLVRSLLKATWTVLFVKPSK